MEETIPTQKSKIAEREEQILKFWQEREAFKKSLEKKSPKGEFVFYDGPPFATGSPHYGHILAGTIKDVIPRFKTMQGFHVPRRWGWDCHGLPVENEVEKELGFQSKKDIVDYGTEKFNALAKESVMRYADDWRRVIPRMGRWVDMVNDYKTMDSAYTESVWFVFKTLFDKGLVYEGFKPMHLCPRCETTLSNFEVTQGYKEVTDTAVYVRFALQGEPNTFLVAWTTTPWTLPGNVALAVNPEKDYAFIEITASNAPLFKMGDIYVCGVKEDILKRIFSEEGGAFEFDPDSRSGIFSWKGERVSFVARQGVSGKTLVGRPYLPLFDYYTKPQMRADSDRRMFADERTQEMSASLERGWRVYGGDFVTEEDGTGIVHIAPAFGEDDYALAELEKLPFIQHVGSDGAFRPEARDFTGLQAKPKGNPRETDERIAALLETRGLLLKKESVTHSYPFCWRCETPLLNFAAPSWFVRVTDLREKLVEENKKVRWIPKEAGEYRFGNWLAEARDWAISRSRFWGAPIPVWRCERCRALRVLGSFDELRARSGTRFTTFIFLRHGESVKNIRHIFDDSPTAFPLTRAGKREAKAAAEQIRKMGGVDAVFASPVRRARESAELLAAPFGKTAKIDERLREVDSGEWDGKREDDLAAVESRARYDALPPMDHYRAKRGENGESWEDVERRMGEFLREALTKHSGERVLVVSHEGPIVYLLKALNRLTLKETNRYFRRERFEEYAKPIVVHVDLKTGAALDPHRPFIDEVRISCDACARETGTGVELMRRVPEVFDCWFESGAMPYAKAHYPFEHDDAFDPIGGWFRKLQ
ncbi:MAG: isoleucyl-tRNA synthetase [Parcubacteria group bacterium Greene0416_79]|nr:MAG: isoleucyl-tRNA synthetase [Parcubacteria group bacterium Greene0416_79]